MGAAIYNLFFTYFVLLCTDFISFEFSSASNVPLCKFDCEMELI